MNTKVNILSKKSQVDNTDDNKNVQVLKKELWMRQIITEAEITIIRESQVVEEIILLEEIRDVTTLSLSSGCN